MSTSDISYFILDILAIYFGNLPPHDQEGKCRDTIRIFQIEHFSAAPGCPQDTAQKGNVLLHE
jgi:hypothetical protein